MLWRWLWKLGPSDPLRLMPWLARTYGDVAQYRVGSMQVVLLNHPDYVREILTVQPENFIKERTMQRSKMLLGEGMITAEGPSHRRQRQAAQPAFHRRTVPGYASTMVECARDVRDSWHDGKQVDVVQEMMAVTLRVVARALFNTEIKDEVGEIAAAINSIMGMYKWLVTLPAIERLVRLPLPIIGRFLRSRERLDRLAYAMIDAHRGLARAGCPPDLLSAMLASADGDGPSANGIRDRVITIFLAGYETTAMALSWTWYLLSLNPRVEQRLHEELAAVLAGRLPTIEDVPKLEYTTRVLAESMRLFPPAWAVGRQGVRDFKLGQYAFPAGTYVVMSQWVMHRDPRFFPDPLRFDPDRFLPEAEARRPRFSYFPFGAGSRQCIGEEFAWKEMALVLAALAQRWKLRLLPQNRIEPEALITLRPRFGMKTICELRT
jgi:cytochrome P450